MWEKTVDIFLDFLFPKSESIQTLENLSSGELIRELPQAETNGDIISLFDYKDERVKSLIWELKYKGNRKIAGVLAEIVIEIMRHELLERAFTENFREALLIPVPTSPERRRERGFNQIEILCEEIVRLDTENLLTYNKDILYKVHHTESQTQARDKKERLNNIKNSMEARTSTRRCAVLLDDVTTTGATLHEARRALKLVGINKIICITLAH